MPVMFRINELNRNIPLRPNCERMNRVEVRLMPPLAQWQIHPSATTQGAAVSSLP